ELLRGARAGDGGAIGGHARALWLSRRRRGRVSAVVRDGKSAGVAWAHGPAPGATHRGGGDAVRPARGRDASTYADLLTPSGLEQIAAYATCIGPAKSLIIPRDGQGRLTRPTSLVADAHAVGLRLHPWTFRAEAAFLPAGMDLERELRAFLAAGVDGFFTDQPDVGVRARDAFVASGRTC